MDILLFLVSFILILVGCEFFTNGVEWLGKKFDLEEGAVGSVLAAVGTAMPETLVPLIAIVLVGGEAGEEIGAGAILGSPFMIATLAMFMCGLAVFLFRKKRERDTLAIEGHLVRRDLKFFLLAYGLAGTAALLPKELEIVKWLIGFSLFPIYIYYMSICIRSSGQEGDEDEEMEELLLHKTLKRLNGNGTNKEETIQDDASEAFRKAVYKSEPGLLLIIVQIALGLTGILLGATMFVDQIEALAGSIGLNPLLLALIVAPIATELPEMFNAVIWVRSGKDTYAMGNLTGAMVFQSCIPVTIGVLLTGWTLNLSVNVELLQAICIEFALLSAVILFMRSKVAEIRYSQLMLGGAFYVIFMALVLMLG
ncbi:MAG: putative membrane protein [Methanomassiliicoccales archaeon PtaU1.Bin124]|nr:MAG: putative membrane protein [Methanomassiliicoccales archaeon PtaU1.Bin124]